MGSYCNDSVVKWGNAWKCNNLKAVEGILHNAVTSRIDVHLQVPDATHLPLGMTIFKWSSVSIVKMVPKNDSRLCPSDKGLPQTAYSHRLVETMHFQPQGEMPSSTLASNKLSRTCHVSLASKGLQNLIIEPPSFYCFGSQCYAAL